MFSLRPEWATQSHLLLAWPHDEAIWGEQSHAITQTYWQLIELLCPLIRIILLCPTPTHQQQLQTQLTQHGITLDCVCVPTDDIWIRDYGPLCLTDPQGTLQLLDFQFNAWGEKYTYDHDNAVNQVLQQQDRLGQHPLQCMDWILEGGSIETDGQGSLLTTRTCLLHDKRNPHLSEKAVEQRLQQDLGISQVIWLDNCILPGDDTDGHIDTLARFCDPGTICYVACDDEQDCRYRPLQNLAEQLRACRNLQGEPYRLVPIPVPALIHNAQGDLLPATYANFLIINQHVIVPSYQVAEDELAQLQLAQAFPNHHILSLDCRTFIHQYGSLHCASMQLPLDYG